MSAQLIFTMQGKRLHLGSWAVNRGSQYALDYRTGRWVPICSTDQGVEFFKPFAPSIHTARPLCKACLVRLAELSALAAATEVQQ
jgi:hypothetical protein